jgi:hypothetical protein
MGDISQARHRNKRLVVWPMRLIKERTFHAVNSVPIDISETTEFRRTELERTTIEYNSLTLLIHTPQPAAIRTTLIPSQQIAMMIHIAEAELPLVSNDKLLIHSSSNLPKSQN